MKRLLELHDEYSLSISATTRKPREGEADGREYFFKTVEEFEKMIAEDALIEHAQYVGNYYGTPKAYVEEQLDKGNNVILEIEATIKARLSRAAEEAEGVEDYDYIVINDEVDLCVGRIHDIVLSEKMKAKYNLGLINNIKEELKVYSKGE